MSKYRINPYLPIYDNEGNAGFKKLTEYDAAYRYFYIKTCVELIRIGFYGKFFALKKFIQEEIDGYYD